MPFFSTSSATAPSRPATALQVSSTILPLSAPRNRGRSAESRHMARSSRTASPKAMACSTVPALASGPSVRDQSVQLLSGCRSEKNTWWPFLTHRPPIVPPIWPAPMVPSGILAALSACAELSAGRNAAPSSSVPPAAKNVRRLAVKKRPFGHQNLLRRLQPRQVGRTNRSRANEHRAMEISRGRGA